MNMEYRYRIGQADLARIYENAQARMNANPEIAEKHRKAIREHSSFKSEKEALQAAIKLRKENHWGCQIWASVEKVDDIYRIQNYWLVTDDGKTKLSADYIGMALMYDEARLLNIIDNNVKIDDVVAYW